MRRGRFRFLLTIEHDTGTQSTSGHRTENWVTFKALRGGVEPVRGSEKFLADQRQADVTHLVPLEYWPGITAKMRVKFEPVDGGDARYLQILSVIDRGERNRSLELRCKEVNPPATSG